MPPEGRLRRMERRSCMYLAGTVAALTAFLFVSLAFSGQFTVVHGGVFVVVTIAVANFVRWAEPLTSN